MKYTLEVHALGYEDTKLTVDVQSKREAKLYTTRAKRQWCEANAVDYSTAGLAFVRIHDGEK